MEKLEMFEEILEGVMKDFNKESWFEVFDSDLFYIVEGRIRDYYYDEDYNAMINDVDYKNWITEMAEDL